MLYSIVLVSAIYEHKAAISICLFTTSWNSPPISQKNWVSSTEMYALPCVKLQSQWKFAVWCRELKSDALCVNQITVDEVWIVIHFLYLDLECLLMDIFFFTFNVRLHPFILLGNDLSITLWKLHCHSFQPVIFANI